MKFKAPIITAGLSVALMAFTTSTAKADSFKWSFASANVSGSGVLNAVAYGTAGQFYITDGSGTVTDSQYGTNVVSFLTCATPSTTCTLQNSDGAGANLQYDNLLFPGNAIGSQLDEYGVILTPGPLGSGADGIGLFDSPSQEFYAYTHNGYQTLTTPFNVTPNSTAVTPEPTSLVLLGTGMLGAVFCLRQRKNAIAAR